MKILVLTVLTVGSAQALSACDLCSVYSATQARGGIGKGIFAGVAEQFTHFGSLQRDGVEVPNETGQHLDSSNTQLLLGYNFNERFGVQVNVPIIHRAFERPEGFAMDRGTETGIGDISLVGHVQVFRHE